LVWHTNTGNEAAPVTSAAVGAYRKDYYHRGILRYLVEDADSGKALDRWKKDHAPPPPKAELVPIQPDEALLGARASEYVVRQKVPVLKVGINDEYPLEKQHVLRWRLVRADGKNVDAADAVELSGTAKRTGRTWEVDLSKVLWWRGEYQL